MCSIQLHYVSVSVHEASLTLLPPAALVFIFLQGKEVDPLACAAAGEGRIQAVHAHGRIPGEGPPQSHPHPATPGRHGQATTPGQCCILTLYSMTHLVFCLQGKSSTFWDYVYLLSF